MQAVIVSPGHNSISWALIGGSAAQLQEGLVWTNEENIKKYQEFANCHCWAHVSIWAVHDSGLLHEESLRLWIEGTVHSESAVTVFKYIPG